MKADVGLMQFADIGPDDPRLAADILPVLRELRPLLNPQSRSADCHLLDLDSATPRTDAHRFYTRERLSIGAFHFVTEL